MNNVWTYDLRREHCASPAPGLSANRNPLWELGTAAPSRHAAHLGRARGNLVTPFSRDINHFILAHSLQNSS